MLQRSLLAIVLILALAGCSFIPGAGGVNNGTLVYDGATEHGLKPGDSIPGTPIRFVAKTDDGAQVTINGQTANKKIGDSLDWRGTVAPGVEVAMAQRIALITGDRLQSVGTIRVTIRGVNPVAGAVPAGGRYSFRVASGYTLRKGQRLPGTTLTFKGKADEGAQFEGTNDYPYRRIGDSLAWSGQLAPGVFLDATWRVGAYTDDLATLAGFATIIIP